MKMNVPEILKTIGEQIQAFASGKLAFAEPVSVADRMVIPVAWVRYDFGAGGGGSAGYARMTDQGGGGGGGGQVSVVPAGIVEITPTGTRFIPIPDGRKIFALIASSFGSAAGMHNTATPNTGNKMLAAAKTPTKKETAARGGANKGTAKKAAMKGSMPPVKKAAAKKAVSAKTSRPLAKKALSKKTAPVKASVKKNAPSAATKKSAAKRP
ncbi:MAG: spore germination protein GerW family protein [Bryobacteraceae bacterium]